MAEKLEFDGVVLDIEGTVCPISFVKEVLVSPGILASAFTVFRYFLSFRLCVLLFKCWFIYIMGPGKARSSLPPCGTSHQRVCCDTSSLQFSIFQTTLLLQSQVYHTSPRTLSDP